MVLIQLLRILIGSDAEIHRLNFLARFYVMFVPVMTYVGRAVEAQGFPTKEIHLFRQDAKVIILHSSCRGLLIELHSRYVKTILFFLSLMASNSMCVVVVVQALS